MRNRTGRRAKSAKKRTYGHRAQHACAYCRRRHEKCINEGNGKPCEACEINGFSCLYHQVDGTPCQWDPGPRTPRIEPTPVPNLLSAHMPDDLLNVPGYREFSSLQLDPRGHIYGFDSSSSRNMIPGGPDSLDFQTELRPTVRSRTPESHMPIAITSHLPNYFSDTTLSSSSSRLNNTNHRSPSDFSSSSSNFYNAFNPIRLPPSESPMSIAIPPHLPDDFSDTTSLSNSSRQRDADHRAPSNFSSSSSNWHNVFNPMHLPTSESQMSVSVPPHLLDFSDTTSLSSSSRRRNADHRIPSNFSSSSSNLDNAFNPQMPIAILPYLPDDFSDTTSLSSSSRQRNADHRAPSNFSSSSSNLDNTFHPMRLRPSESQMPTYVPPHLPNYFSDTTLLSRWSRRNNAAQSNFSAAPSNLSPSPMPLSATGCACHTGAPCPLHPGPFRYWYPK